VFGQFILFVTYFFLNTPRQLREQIMCVIKLFFIGSAVNFIICIPPVGDNAVYAKNFPSVYCIVVEKCIYVSRVPSLVDKYAQTKTHKVFGRDGKTEEIG